MSKYLRLLSNPHRLIGAVPKLSASGSANALSLFAKSRIRDDTLLKAISGQLAACYHELSPIRLVQCVYGLAKFHFNEDGGKTYGLLASHARRHMREYSLDDCAQILSSLSRVKVKNQALLDRVAGSITPESVGNCATRSLVNLMSAFARFGVKPTKKSNPWTFLADELAGRLEAGEPASTSDLLAALTAYSVHFLGRAHAGLFASASSALLRGAPLTMEDACKYVKACSRTQYRNLETLSACASAIRGSQIETATESQLLDLYTGLDKLGVEVKEVDAELLRRGVTIPSPSSGSTWFRQAAPVPSKRKGEKSEPVSLRRRKATW